MYKIRYCSECEHFNSNKKKKKGAFLWYGCKVHGYIPQGVRNIKDISCWCGAFIEKQEEQQLSLF